MHVDNPDLIVKITPVNDHCYGPRVKPTLWGLHLTEKRAVIVKPIPEEIVEKTWKEVAQFTPAQI